MRKIMKFKWLGFSFFIMIFLAGCNQLKESKDLKGDYFGQTMPQLTPEIFAPGIISTAAFEMNAAFSPDGKEFYFSMADPYQNFNVIMFMKRDNDKWTPPQVASFSGKHSDFDPFFSIDGNRLYFISRRPLKEQEKPNEDTDIWFVERTETGWAEPQNAGLTVNSDKDEYYISVTKDGTLYFTSACDGGKGSWDIYRSKFIDGNYAKPENLGDSINCQYPDWDPFIAADESYIIFTSARPGGHGGGDLYICFRKEDGSWTKAKNLGDKINSSDYEYCPAVSPDGKFFFFSRFGGSSQKFHSQTQRTYNEFIEMFNSVQNGLGNIYWVDHKIIDVQR